MAYQSLRLTGGVNVSETPALNQAGIASSQLVRFKPDPGGMVLVEKLGGWAKFYASQVTTVVRALLAWEDTNANKWIAFGTSDPVAAQLTAIGCNTNASGTTTATGQVYTLTPQYYSAATPLVVQTTAGSSNVSVTDNVVTGVSSYDAVMISTPISVGGLVLFGQYTIASGNGLNQYTITATNVLGNPSPALYTTVASPLTVTAGSYSAGAPSTITYTYGVQASPPFVVGDTVNASGVVPSTWNGSCIVTACTTTQVTVLAPSAASGVWSSGGAISNYGCVPILSVVANSAIVTVTLPEHGQTVGSTFSILNQSVVGSITLYGNYYVTSVLNAYSFTINASSTATATTSAYLGALSIVGGSSTTTHVTLTTGNATFNEPVVTVTGGSSTTTHVTLTWTSGSPYTYTVGSSIYVSGASPNAWNGTYAVTGSTTTTVTYALSGSALSWISGGTIQSPAFNLGSAIQVAGILPDTWNGNFTVTDSTPSTVTYALSGSALSWVSGGTVADIGGDATVAYSITPGPLPSFSGWGAGPYGAGGWGTGITPTQISGSPIYASNWALDNWGEYLLASAVGFSAVQYVGVGLTYSPIYAWDPALKQPEVAALTNGPPATTGFFVAMPQRQIIAWGTTFAGIIDPLLVRWCDVSNYNVWIGQITNQAGSYRLSTGSAIIGGMQVMQQGMLWTDVGLWTMQYTGPPYIYSFNQIALGCGLIARRAAGVLNGVVYWMGSQQFFTYSGEGVQPIVCPVWDAVYQQLDLGNVAKITVAVNSLFEEVTWYYPVIGGNGECSAYVKYNLLTSMWDMGSLGRTAWIDNSVLGPPIGYDPVNQLIYQHEIAQDADGSPIAANFTTGYFAIAEGQMKAFLDEVWPDFKWGYYNQSQGASVQITFNATDFPGQTPTTYGPYTVTQGTKWFNPRIRSRLLSVTVSSNDAGSFWRTGAFRYRVAADGRY